MSFFSNVSSGMWDIALIVVVSVMAAVLSYVSDPRWKAFLATPPLPFTLAALAVGRRIDATNVIGLFLLFLFIHGVRVLHVHARVPILAAIATCALAYCVCGMLLVPVVPATDLAFWTSTGLVMIAGTLPLILSKPRDEPHYRTQLPVWIKVPVVLGIIFALVMLKHLLESFMTMFPMVSTIAAYETRHSLWTTSRQFSVLMLTLAPMLAVCRLAQTHVGLPAALGVGWVVYLLIAFPLTRLHQGPVVRLPRRVKAAAPR